ncbi:hypothetical protein BH11BAC6_BH11BAC6_04600 [soil metagenome]
MIGNASYIYQMRFASIKQIEIIGEAAYFVTTETKTKFTEIAWEKIAGIRHILVHEYFGIDDQIVWQVILTDIPTLRLGACLHAPQNKDNLRFHLSHNKSSIKYPTVQVCDATMLNSSNSGWVKKIVVILFQNIFLVPSRLHVLRTAYIPTVLFA